MFKLVENFLGSDLEGYESTWILLIKVACWYQKKGLVGGEKEGGKKVLGFACNYIPSLVFGVWQDFIEYMWCRV